MAVRPWSTAWAQASASVPKDRVQLYTLEFNHIFFHDEGGDPVAVRYVADTRDQVLRIEAGAPMNAGQDVTFMRAWFDLTWPKLEDMSFQGTIAVDNIGREITPFMIDASKSGQEIQMILRCYISTAPTIVARGPHYFTLFGAEITGDRFTATYAIALPDSYKFLRDTYDQKRFKALLAAGAQ